jgi:hypothetical protein
MEAMSIIALIAFGLPSFTAASGLPDLYSVISLGHAEQFVLGLTRYPGYAGELNVSGRAKIRGAGLLNTATQTLSWNLKGVDPRCENPPIDVKNSCGVHIHEGFSCDDAGGHYWDSALIPEDPWLVIRYTAKHFSFRKGPHSAHTSGVEVNTAVTNYDVLGRTMVVHDATGARVACGLISPKKLSVSAFAPYAGYKGSLKVEGKIGVVGDDVEDAHAQDLQWALSGMDPNCSEAPPADIANACGIHIHEGHSCYTVAGGHYWDRADYQVDPWVSVTYSSWKFPWSSYAYEHSEVVTTGLANHDVNGRTMIVHDATGARVACGILAPEKEIVNAFVPYFSYSGSLKVSGTVFVEGQGVLTEASQELHWILYGVDPDCNNGRGDAGNSCGVHIHTGMDCTSDAKGHFWNATAISDDPWATVSYTTKSFWGQTYAADFYVNVVTGVSNFDTLGHTLIVHDYTGRRIACGILNIAA